MAIRTEPEVEIGQRVVISVVARLTGGEHPGRHERDLPCRVAAALSDDQAVLVFGQQRQMSMDDRLGQRPATRLAADEPGQCLIEHEREIFRIEDAAKKRAGAA